MAAHPLLFVFPFAMAYAAMMDIFTMRIANGVSIAVVVAFLIVAPIAAMPAQEMLMHLGVGAAMLVVGMILFSIARCSAAETRSCWRPPPSGSGPTSGCPSSPLSLFSAASWLS